MKGWISLMLPLAAACLVGAGCGGDDDEGDGGSAAGAAVRVGMKELQYVPKDVKVKAGDTVRWTNSDSVTHTVTKERGPGRKFDSGNMSVGATFEQRFERPGKVVYICTIHPNQTVTVTVE